MCHAASGDSSLLRLFSPRGSKSLTEVDMECWNWAFSTGTKIKLKPGTLALWFKVLLTTLDSLLLLLALLGNTATLFILHRIRGQSGRLSYLLGSLVVSDLLTVLFLVTFDLPHLWHDNFTWVLGSALCRMAAFLQTVAVLANSITLIAIAVDRYLSIVHPHRPRPCPGWCSRHEWVFFCGLLLLSCGVSAPYLVYYRLEGPYMSYSLASNNTLDHFTCPDYFCWSGSEAVHEFEVGLVCVIFLPLLVTFCICYSNLIYFLYTRPTVGLAEARQLARKRKVVLTLACVVATFLVFRLPSWVLLLLPQTTDLQEMKRYLTHSYAHFSLHTLTLCAPALNPFLYTLIHQTYRQHLPSPLARMLCSGLPTKVVAPVPSPSPTMPSVPTLTTNQDTVHCHPPYAKAFPHPTHLTPRRLSLTMHLATLQEEGACERSPGPLELQGTTKQLYPGPQQEREVTCTHLPDVSE